MNTDEVKNIMEALSDKQKDMFSANEKEVKKNFLDMQQELDKVKTELKKGIDRDSHNDLHSSLLNGMNNEGLRKGLIANSVDYTFNIKQNAMHQPTDFTPSANLPIAPFTQEPGVSKLMYADSLISNLIQWGMTSGPYVGWVERKSKVDGSAMRAEDAIMGEGSLQWEQKDVQVKILSEYMKMSNESLKDYVFASGEINSELMDDIKNLLEIQLMTGDGTGNNLLGILPQATLWAPSIFANAVSAPNIADVLRVGINQIFVAGNGRYFPSAIVLHPNDVTGLDLLKITDGRYIEVPFYDGETSSLAKVKVVQNTRVLSGEFLIADFNRAKGFLRDGLSIRVWNQNEDDVLYNRSTVTANMRTAFRIKTPDLTAFVKGDFASAITALTK